MTINIKHLCFGFLATITSVSVAQENPVQMLEDLAIPLMAGLAENMDGALVFDSPEGRIINAEASGSVNSQQAYQYYRVVLPSLGWQVESDKEAGMICEGNAVFCLVAVREDENLSLNIEEANGSSKITYSLSPN